MAKSNVAIAPRAGVVGSKTHGGHILAWRSCKALPEGKVQFVLTNNPWRAGTPGSEFCEAVIMPLVERSASGKLTVAEVMAVAKELGFKAAESMSHLRWLYTWGPFVKVNGAFYGEAQPEPKAPKARKAKAPKAQAEAPASAPEGEPQPEAQDWV